MNIAEHLSPESLTNADWRDALGGEFDEDYFQSLVKFCQAQSEGAGSVFPPSNQIFSAFNLTPLAKVRVIILGQDPYHGPSQAMGLSFSTPPDVPIPPSLRNIYKEISSDIGEREFPNGDLTNWARQGVLLLNSVLTVNAGRAGSHRGKGWEQFTDVAIRVVSQRAPNAVFMLWGAWAISKKALIDEERHLVLEAPHPSPLSAYRGFFGCRHFSKANSFLQKNGRAPIDW